jgi:hypothetical protein
MITKETFIQMINLVERFNEEINRWDDFGLNILDQPIISIPWEIFDTWTNSNFNEDGADWINWYIYERISIITKELLPCYDEEGNIFYVNTPEELWDLVKDHQLTNENNSKECNN